ncbi:cyclophilin-like fold protein [Entomomonas asaccharolytica]|uniref:Cyclophilin-like domain-containing protein n=1 Tax=Entomomonas asaccharolytica TaxID=2785331 RepID=A0A974ND52_9GAMM|nr:cyclophilin-like fold protein [Entomomonas asaccharolytica]QQP84312.1 hypothetical protein JHT90_07685 [Entomomonas asaccharolytica]
MNKLIITFMICFFSIVSYAKDNQTMTDVQIKLIMNDKIVTATLVDNETTRDFIKLLPLNLTLEDYANTEKISNLPKKLSTKGVPAGYTPSKGDIAYYAPWGNLAIFHKNFSYSRGLVILAKLDSDIELFEVQGSINVKIELIK